GESSGDERQRWIDRIGLLVAAHQQVGDALLDTTLAVLAVVVFRDERVRESRARTGSPAVDACGRKRRTGDRRGGRFLASEAKEPALLLLRRRCCRGVPFL